MLTDIRTSIAQALNDDLRKRCIVCAVHGSVKGATGAILLTPSFQHESDMWVIGALDAVRNFTAFDADKDPEHKLALTPYEGKNIRAEFYYFEDATMKVGTEDAVECYRVLRIGMAEELRDEKKGAGEKSS
jgi:hypothetical protein